MVHTVFDLYRSTAGVVTYLLITTNILSSHTFTVYISLFTIFYLITISKLLPYSYCRMEQEKAHHLPTDSIIENNGTSPWPSKGEIVMNGVCLRYRRGLPLGE